MFAGIFVNLSIIANKIIIIVVCQCICTWICIWHSLSIINAIEDFYLRWYEFTFIVLFSVLFSRSFVIIKLFIITCTFYLEVISTFTNILSYEEQNKHFILMIQSIHLFTDFSVFLLNHLNHYILVTEREQITIYSFVCLFGDKINFEMKNISNFRKFEYFRYCCC